MTTCHPWLPGVFTHQTHLTKIDVRLSAGVSTLTWLTVQGWKLRVTICLLMCMCALDPMQIWDTNMLSNRQSQSSTRFSLRRISVLLLQIQKISSMMEKTHPPQAMRTKMEKRQKMKQEKTKKNWRSRAFKPKSNV